jgi:hypothetical protein
MPMKKAQQLLNEGNLRKSRIPPFDYRKQLPLILTADATLPGRRPRPCIRGGYTVSLHWSDDSIMTGAAASRRALGSTALRGAGG